MKGYMKKKGLILAVFILLSITLEITVFLMNFGHLPKYLLFDLSFLFYFCAILILVGGPKTEMVISMLILTGQIVLCFVNANMIKVTGEVWSWDMLSLLSEAAEVLGRNFIVNYGCIILFIFLGVLGLYAMIRIVMKKEDEEGKINHFFLWKVRLSALCLCLLLGMGLSKIQVSTLNIYSKELKTGNDLYLYETLYIKQEAYKKFGTLGYYFLDAKKTIFDDLSTKTKEHTVEQLDKYFDEGKIVGSSQTPLENEYAVSEGNNVIVILYETGEWMGINKDITPNIYNLLTGTNDKYGKKLDEAVLLSQYYAKNQTNISESQMLFGSYPLKGILNFDYEENAYPFTLPSMFKTAYPKGTTVSYHNNYGNYYDRENSHLHYGFDSHVSASEMELTKGSTWINLDSEMAASCLISNERYTGCDAIVPSDTSEPFLRYLASFTTHGPHFYRDEFEDLGYYDIVEAYAIANNYEFETLHGDIIDMTGVKYEEAGGMETAETYQEIIFTYLAAAYDFDKCIGLIVDELRQNDLLEKTTIVTMADHYAYYHWISDFIKGYEEGDMEISDVYNIPAFIFDTKLSAKLKSEMNGSDSAKLENGNNVFYKNYLGDEILCYDKFLTNIDLTPTLLNILGIEYNSNHYNGYSAFSKEESLILSRWGGYFNNVFYSNDGITPIGLPRKYYEYEDKDIEEIEFDEEMTKEEYLQICMDLENFKKQASDFLIRIDMINKMYKCDYFNE